MAINFLKTLGRSQPTKYLDNFCHLELLIQNQLEDFSQILFQLKLIRYPSEDLVDPLPDGLLRLVVLVIAVVQALGQPQLANELDALGLAGVPVVGGRRPHQAVRRLGRQISKVLHQSLMITEAKRARPITFSSF